MLTLSEICGRTGQSPTAAPPQPCWWQVGLCPCPPDQRVQQVLQLGLWGPEAPGTSPAEARGSVSACRSALVPRKMRPFLVWPEGPRLRAGASGPLRRERAGAWVCRAAVGRASAPPVPAAGWVHVLTPQQDLGSPRAEPRARKPHEPVPARAQGQQPTWGPPPRGAPSCRLFLTTGCEAQNSRRENGSLNQVAGV